MLQYKEIMLIKTYLVKKGDNASENELQENEE